jgi:hypothetical protein
MAELQLSSPYNSVLKRDSTTILVENFKRRKPDGFDSFSSGNAFHTLGAFEKSVFNGDNVIDDLSMQYPQLQIKDFELRPNSSFTVGGRHFNFVGSALSSPFGRTINTLQVMSTDEANPLILEADTDVSRFASSGHIFIAGTARTLFEYTSKTATGFIGYVVRGDVNIPLSTEFIQYSTD